MHHQTSNLSPFKHDFHRWNPDLLMLNAFFVGSYPCLKNLKIYGHLQMRFRDVTGGGHSPSKYDSDIA